MDFELMYPGFESRESHDFYYFFMFLALLLQCKFANSTLLSLLSFSYLITPYDAQASSAFGALILSYDVAVIQWIMSCQKTRTATHFITRWRERVRSMTTSLSTMRFIIEIM